MMATLACSINIELPRLKTGATETFAINEPLPSSSYEIAKINLEMGAGTLNLAGGADGLVEGTIKYNIAEWKPTVGHLDDGTIDIRQSQTSSVKGVPTNTVVNDWQIKLSSSTPLDLTLKTGANTGTLDMSGLHLRKLSVTDGASKTRMTFDKPNPEKLDSFTYTTGASQVELRGLANANFTSMMFSSGAGDYTLDFSGELKQDTSVDIKSGVSNMTIIIPKNTDVKLVNMGAISNIEIEGNWTVNGSTYTTNGEGYLLDIHVNMSIGNLKLIYK
jgi:hypothetical protein